MALELPRPRLGLRDEGEHVVPGRVRHAVRDPDNIAHIKKHSLSKYCLSVSHVWIWKSMLMSAGCAWLVTATPRSDTVTVTRASFLLRSLAESRILLIAALVSSSPVAR